MILRHLHLPGPIPYTKAAQIQERIVGLFLSRKANPSATPAPEPLVITTEFEPVYTCGRREIRSLTSKQRAYLTEETRWGHADFFEALRGGQTTFHGPGQLVAYPILDLRHHNLSPRCYIHGLESAVMATCAHYDIATQRTENPGVWADGNNKICAVGVHLRRHISSHGIGLNVSTELGWFDRVVACGLEGKGTTSLRARGATDASVDAVGQLFVQNLAENVIKDVDAVLAITEDDLD